MAENLLARLSDRHLGALATAYEALANGMAVSLNAFGRLRGFLGRAPPDSE